MHQQTLIEALQSSQSTTLRVSTALAGTLVTVGMWLVHLRYPYLLFGLGFFGAVVIVPPFFTVMSLGYLFFPDITVASDDEPGPMDGYMRQVQGDRRWKITVFAAAAGAANLLFMWSTR
jgi:hypothetical protein